MRSREVQGELGRQPCTHADALRSGADEAGMYGRTLGLAGLEASTCPSVDEALEMLGRTRFDVIASERKERSWMQ